MIVIHIVCAMLWVRFGQNIINDPGHVDIFPASRIPKHIHHLLKPIHRLTSGASRESVRLWNNVKEKGFRIITEHRTLHSVLQWTSDDEVALTFLIFFYSIFWNYLVVLFSTIYLSWYDILDNLSYMSIV